MIEHLSGEQISQWMIGERSPQMERHVAECSDCLCRLEQLETTLSQFRGAMRNVSGPAIPAWNEPASRGFWFSWRGAVLATALLLLSIAAPVYWASQARERAATAARADAQLLEQVDSEISRAVPEPMEPLVNLVTWNSNSNDEAKKAERQ